MSKINGLLFTGGSTGFTSTPEIKKSGEYMFKKILEMNDKGIHFPVFGICLGFEFLIKFSTNHEVLFKLVEK